MQIVDAVFERPGRLMLTGQTSPSAQLETDGGPTLHLNYRNFSGKDIDSVVLTGWIKVKDDPYQLDYVVRPFQLVLSRKSLLGKDVQAQQALVLGGNAYGLDRIALSRVIYADGSIWMPELNRCVYRSLGSTEQAKAW
ncbi:hypothetical protein ACPOL_5257 [Acidisarcina polymorpha]|uniref:Uncharacterized protein n=1 Tax=Acidisarcina polymorpha TaxID=2211140 RepID=A0A2Z5G5Z1_9BACT|nr:hypothetical protein ACPOL_5257 [Acidisarcina polymorpha]